MSTKTASAESADRLGVVFDSGSFLFGAGLLAADGEGPRVVFHLGEERATLHFEGYAGLGRHTPERGDRLVLSARRPRGVFRLDGVWAAPEDADYASRVLALLALLAPRLPAGTAVCAEMFLQALAARAERHVWCLRVVGTGRIVSANAWEHADGELADALSRVTARDLGIGEDDDVDGDWDEDLESRVEVERVPEAEIPEGVEIRGAHWPGRRKAGDEEQPMSEPLAVVPLRLVERLAAARPPQAGWVHLYDDRKVGIWWRMARPLVPLFDEHGPGTLFWLPADKSYDITDFVESDDPDPETLWRNDVGTYGAFEGWPEPNILLRVEPTGRAGEHEFTFGEHREVARGADPDDSEEYFDVLPAFEYRVAAVHSPRDVYGPKGTPMRDLLESLAGGGACGMAGLERRLAPTTGDEERLIEACERAASEALFASSELPWSLEWFKHVGADPFPNDCMFFFWALTALAARHLTGTTPEWTQAAYDYLSRRFVAATGLPLHPDDEAAVVGEGAPRRPTAAGVAATRATNPQHTEGAGCTA